MIKLIFLYSFLFLNSIYSQTSVKAFQQQYIENLKIVKKYLDLKDGDTIKLNIQDACYFLEEASDIKINMVCSFDPTYFPSEQNYLDLKTWFQENKSFLYWDKKEKKVKVKKKV